MPRPLSLSLLFLALALSSCAAPAISQDSPTAPQTITAGDRTAANNRLTLTLTLSSPEDLRVKEGDRVEAGQILSDRVRDRQRLEAQLEQITLQIQKVSQPISGPPPVRPIPAVAGLPPASFLDELATVQQAQLKVTQAERNVAAQQRMVDMLASMPDANLPEATIPHETEVLEQRNRELDQARADLQLAQAQLAEAQADRQHDEYLYSLEMSKRAIAIQAQELERQSQLQQQQAEERDRSFELAQLTAQKQNLEAQLYALSAVRAPYAGVIQRIKLEGQNDQSLIVELTLIVNSGNSGSPAPGSSPEPEPGASPSDGTP